LKIRRNTGILSIKEHQLNPHGNNLTGWSQAIKKFMRNHNDPPCPEGIGTEGFLVNNRRVMTDDFSEKRA
jgi:hypothetical protein